jgi:3-isopropylmalate/(R)-2-methylmalate dehydratase small subunit
MEPFTRLTATACPLPFENIDTDQLIPARFMSRSRASGYGSYLLHDQRFDAEGAPREGYPLDHPRFQGAAILVARRNFGSGSSREAAVYALWDYGIRCVVAPSFGDIFASNAVKNGLLPAVVSEREAERLLACLADAPAPSLTIDLERQNIAAGEDVMSFAIDPVRRLQLLNGWDDLDMTLARRSEIASYRARHLAEAPWAFPGA